VRSWLENYTIAHEHIYHPPSVIAKDCYHHFKTLKKEGKANEMMLLYRPLNEKWDGSDVVRAICYFMYDGVSIEEPYVADVPDDLQVHWIGEPIKSN
jgi:hypothetical protein